MEIPPFPEEGEKDGGLVEVSLEELLLNRRGIAGGNSVKVSARDFFFLSLFTSGSRGRFELGASELTILRQGLPEVVES